MRGVVNDQEFPQQGAGAVLGKGEVRRVDPRHVAKLTRLLDVLESATDPREMDKDDTRFHSLTGDQLGRYSVRVDKNWRVTFGWTDWGPDAIDVDYEDYH